MRPQPGDDFAGEEFESAYDVLLRQVAEEARHQLQPAETELVVQFGDPRGDRVRAADDSDLAQLGLGFELLLGRDPPLDLLAAAAIAGS